MHASWRARLAHTSGLEVSDEQAERMRAHWSLVQQWAPRLNLTATRDENEAIERHFGDALRVVPLLGDAGPWADIGSGAGFPGLVAAAMAPHQRILLIEPRHRRAAFLETVASRLGLGQVEICCQRAQGAVVAPCAAVMTRATFSSVTELAALGRWLVPDGRLVAQRTLGDPRDGSEALAGFEGPQRHPYQLAGRPRSCDVWIWTPQAPYTGA